MQWLKTIQWSTFSESIEKIIVEEAFDYLDAEPVTLTAKDHRPAYGSDGDYFSKPSIDDIIETIYQMMSEYNPSKYPSLKV